MVYISLICYTCLSTNAREYYSLRKLDDDEVPLIDKLKLCMKDIVLHDDDPQNVCSNCLQSIQIAHKFMQLLTTTQNTLKQVRAQPTSDNVVTNINSNQSIDGPNENKSIKKKVSTKNINLVECEYSDMQLKNQTEQKIHRSQKHGKAKKIICNICGKTVLYSIIDHIDTHCRENTVKCVLCNREYKHLRGISRHIKADHNSENPDIQCLICNERIVKENTEHMIMHRDNSLKCSLCNTFYFTETIFQEHMKTHDDE